VSSSASLPVPCNPVAARGHTPVAAFVIAAIDSGDPTTCWCLPWMRGSMGYAPVASAAAPVACGMDAATLDGRRRPISGRLMWHHLIRS
jgi:hypothetical protein